MRIRPAIGALSLCFLIGCEEEPEPAPGQFPHLTDYQRYRIIVDHCGEPY